MTLEQVEQIGETWSEVVLLRYWYPLQNRGMVSALATSLIYVFDEMFLFTQEPGQIKEFSNTSLLDPKILGQIHTMEFNFPDSDVVPGSRKCQIHGYSTWIVRYLLRLDNPRPLNLMAYSTMIVSYIFRSIKPTYLWLTIWNKQFSLTEVLNLLCRKSRAVWFALHQVTMIYVYEIIITALNIGVWRFWQCSNPRWVLKQFEVHREIYVYRGDWFIHFSFSFSPIKPVSELMKFPHDTDF